MTSQTPFDYWENRYRDRGRSWSGNVNAALEREIGSMTPGTALDLGCGEGGDARWLARRGWRVTAVDIAPTALQIGSAEQSADDDITWIAADLSDWEPPATYDLVTACFLHSSVTLPREEILRRNAAAVAAGGTLLIVGHCGIPHWAEPDEAAHAVELPTPAEVYSSLFDAPSSLDAANWSIVTSALVERSVIAPDGSVGLITDSVLRLLRAGSAG